MSKESETKKNFIASSIVSVFIIAICQSWWPDLIPFGTWDFWAIKGGLIDWLVDSWPVLAWGVGVNVAFTIYHAFRKPNVADIFENALKASPFRSAPPSGGQVFIVGTLISLWAGVAEEIAFRWLIWMGAFAGLAIGNFLLSGTMGAILLGILVGAIIGYIFGNLASRDGAGLAGAFGGVIGLFIAIGVAGHYDLSTGIPELFHLYVWGPLADYTTFGYLHDYIFHPTGWLVGGALLYSNAFFRDGHKYQGLLGFVNSWFIGMYFFWMLFEYGLLACIVVHFTYDFLIFTFAALKQGVLNLRRKRGR